MTKRRDVVLALKALAAGALPAAKIDGFDEETSRPVTVPLEGIVIGYPGSPGDPIAVDLSPACYFWDHRVSFDVAPGPVGDQSAALDAMLSAIGAAIGVDPTLGGLCDHVEPTSPSEEDESLPGTAGQRWATFDVIASYSTFSPLG